MLWFSKKPKHLPAATGPFTPGCSDVMLDYEKDGLFFRLYYPTSISKDAESQSERRYYWLPTDINILLGIAKVIKVPYYILRLVFWWNGNPLVPVLYGEKVKIEENMKCIILSHGLGGYRALYSKVCYDLASQGYLVASLEHRDQSSLYTYCYDSQANAQKDKKTHIEFKHIPFGEDHLNNRKDQINFRAAECLKTVEFFKQLNSGVVPKNILDDVEENKKHIFRLADLVGQIDVDNFTIMGHSFGAATALATIPKTSSIKQCIALDPWMFPIKDDNLQEKIDGKPLLVINTQTFHIISNVNAMAKFMANEKIEMYTILQTTHENQTDSAMVAGYWLNLFMRKIDPHEALKINNALIMKFLHEHVGLPNNVEEFENYLEKNRLYFEKGLTKPYQ